MILRSLLFTLLLLLTLLTTSCIPTSQIIEVTESTRVAASKATFQFINRSESDISLNLYTGYDKLPKVSRGNNQDQYRQTLDYYERSNSLMKKQMIELRGLQKRSETYPPYLVVAEMQTLGLSFMREREEWKRRYPLPDFYHKIVDQVRNRSFHAGIFPQTESDEPNIILEIPSRQIVMLFVKEGRNKRVKELTHFIPDAGKSYELIYQTEQGETALKQQSGKVQFYYGVLDLYEVSLSGERLLISSTDPKSALLNHPERFEAHKYALLLKIFEQLISYSQMGDETESVEIVDQERRQ